MLSKAIETATFYHGEQRDKSNVLYILHPLRVMLALQRNGASLDQQIAGVLHDTIEDTEFSLNEMSNAGFSSAVIRLVSAMTKRNYETYQEYLNRLVRTPEAIDIKIADVKDNLDTKRMLSLPLKERDSMTKRYYNALIFLMEERHAT